MTLTKFIDVLRLRTKYFPCQISENVIKPFRYFEIFGVFVVPRLVHCLNGCDVIISVYALTGKMNNLLCDF